MFKNSTRVSNRNRRLHTLLIAPSTFRSEMKTAFPHYLPGEINERDEIRACELVKLEIGVKVACYGHVFVHKHLRHHVQTVVFPTKILTYYGVRTRVWKWNRDISTYKSTLFLLCYSTLTELATFKTWHLAFLSIKLY